METTSDWPIVIVMLGFFALIAVGVWAATKLYRRHDG